MFNNKLFYFFLMLVVPFAGFTINANRVNIERMCRDLDVIKNTFDVMYAPADWKKGFADWDLAEKIDQAKIKVMQNKNLTLKDYQRIVLEFFNSTKDYHVGVSFYSTELAILPFRVHSVNGRYFVAWVWNDLFNVFFQEPFQIGDEILSFNDRPIDEIVQEVKKSDFGNPDSETDQALAESSLTFRFGSSGTIVPKGPVKIEIRHTGTNIVSSYKMEWMHFPEEIASPFFSKAFVDKGVKKDVNPNFYLDMTAPFYKNYSYAKSHAKNLLKKRLKNSKARYEEDDEDEDDDEDDEDDDCEMEEDNFIGDYKSFVPELGNIVWQSESNEWSKFHAYIYVNDDGRMIGYVRIPHYMMDELAASEFSEIINLFEKSTDALVLDQLNNPGGNTLFMYAIAAMLADKPLFVPKERMMITQEEVYSAWVSEDEFDEIENDEDAIDTIGESVYGYPVDYEFAKQISSYFKFIMTEWSRGKHFTEANYLLGIDKIKPHPWGHYSKPILFLVNNLDFSCGDFMPAILQDSKRATIFGSKTAGAGGIVLQHSFPNLFGIEEYSFTGSIAERLDLSPIENLGVTPDIEADLTENDLENGYPDYVKKIHKAVKKILKN